ncbi:DUF4414 domain-containing protein [Thiomicrorhabdus aquaedulcis]|uniref:DUF4414 domain-containing protein n=1 Tax=Thiomicrorhabdus aquaedulcis TaxID=2211106 RepID=UPI000FD9AC3A|nr:DUF4414 domain-containing protein [Thiomicrorhabdus aquaedulcis]
MPGSNHDVDPSFMDALPLALREAALELIRFSTLKDMLIMRKNGPSERLKTSFALTPMQWNELLNAVILTKVSYFDIAPKFPNQYIDKLHEIAANAFGMPGKNPADLYQAMLTDHPYFAQWLTKSLQVKQQNLRAARAHAVASGTV